jgi:hypothetical protein
LRHTVGVSEELPFVEPEDLGDILEFRPSLAEFPDFRD